MSSELEPGSESDRLPIITLGAGVAAFVLGCVGLAMQIVPPPDEGPAERTLNVAYQALQLFVLDGGALDHVEGFSWVLQIARFLAPAVTILAILLGLRALFAGEVRRRRIAATTGHTIVCGNDAAATALAQNLEAAGKEVVLVSATEVRLGDRIRNVVGDPRHVATLEAAGVRGAAAVYALADRSAANAAVALAAGSLRAGSAARLATFAQVRSDELVDALRVRRLAADRLAAVTLDFFALDEIGARVLLSMHPHRERTPVVLGFGALGQAVLRAVVRRPAAGSSSRVIVSGVDEVTVRDEARRLRAGDRGWTVQAGGAHDGNGPVYVCLEDEDEAVAAGLRLARDAEHEDAQQPGSGFDVVVCLRRASPFREALTGDGRLKIFGVLDAACTEDAIAEDSIVARTARAIHERYLAAARTRGETATTNPSAVTWDELPTHLRESNRAQAEHTGAKLTDIGANLSTRRPNATFAFTEPEVLQLAMAEHVRWKEEREAAGFGHGPSRTDSTHPDLVDWPNLVEPSQAKDIEAVRNLPDLLADEGLYIVRGRVTER